MATINFRAMNTDVVAFAQNNWHVDGGLRAAKGYIEEAENRFSRFLPGSELSQFNEAAGMWTRVSADFMEILALSLRYHEESQGLFDPSVLPDLISAGYDRSLDQVRAAAGTAHPTATKQTHERQESSFRPPFLALELDSEGLRARMPAGMAVDLGGIAKGWIVEQAALLLSTFSSPCAVSAGGDMFFVGVPTGGSPWQVELEDPRDPSRVLARFSAGPGAVVTSTVTKRVWSKDSVMNHHIIDPRTGRSAETDWLSVTVAAREAAQAEAYAKVLLIGGHTAVQTLHRRVADLTFVCVDEDGALHWSQDPKEFINDDLNIRN